MSVIQLTPGTSEEDQKQTFELTDNFSKICEGFKVSIVKDALLTLVTWWAADTIQDNKLDEKEFINAITNNLKKAIKIQIAANSK